MTTKNKTTRTSARSKPYQTDEEVRMSRAAKSGKVQTCVCTLDRALTHHQNRLTGPVVESRRKQNTSENLVFGALLEDTFAMHRLVRQIRSAAGLIAQLAPVDGVDDDDDIPF